jgi:hypothetical protein
VTVKPWDQDQLHDTKFSVNELQLYCCNRRKSSSCAVYGPTQDIISGHHPCVKVNNACTHWPKNETELLLHSFGPIRHPNGPQSLLFHTPRITLLPVGCGTTKPTQHSIHPQIQQPIRVAVGRSVSTGRPKLVTNCSLLQLDSVYILTQQCAHHLLNAISGNKRISCRVTKVGTVKRVYVPYVIPRACHSTLFRIKKELNVHLQDVSGAFSNLYIKMAFVSL